MFLPFFAEIPTTPYSGKAASIFFVSAPFKSILLAAIKTGIFLATKFPMIVTFTWLYGFLLESKTTTTASTSSSHFIASIRPWLLLLPLLWLP